MKQHILLGALVLGLAAAVLPVLLAQKPAGKGGADRPDPLVVAADTHKLVFENNLVRVLETRLPPGAHEPRHYHPHGVTVYLSDFQVHISEDGKPPVTRERKGGTAVWSEAVVHEVHNVGQTPGHVIRVELKF